MIRKTESVQWRRNGGHHEQVKIEKWWLLCILIYRRETVIKA